MGMGGGGGRGEVNADINVTPMADVMLVLLIIFMVITPMLQKGISSVEMAKTHNPSEMTEADKEDSILVSIARDGKFYLCLLYTSDAADERSSVDLGGRRI